MGAAFLAPGRGEGRDPGADHPGDRSQPQGAAGPSVIQPDQLGQMGNPWKSTRNGGFNRKITDQWGFQ